MPTIAVTSGQGNATLGHEHAHEMITDEDPHVEGIGKLQLPCGQCR